jgi:hypothetical protein
MSGYVQILTVDLSPQLELPGREAEYLPPFGTEVKNERSYTSTPLVSLQGLHSYNLASLIY